MTRMRRSLTRLASSRPRALAPALAARALARSANLSAFARAVSARAASSRLGAFFPPDDRNPRATPPHAVQLCSPRPSARPQPRVVRPRPRLVLVHPPSRSTRDDATTTTTTRSLRSSPLARVVSRARRAHAAAPRRIIPRRRAWPTLASRARARAREARKRARRARS